MPKRKGPVQIRFELIEILRYSGKPMKKTHLWRMTSLSYDDFIKHIEFLKAKGLVGEVEEGYVLTKKGREVYDNLRNYILSLF